MSKRFALVVCAGLVTLSSQPQAGAPPQAHHVPTIEQFMSFAFPQELVSARKVDRIAWIANDKGRRNVYTAAAPGFKAVRVTQYMDDDGIDLTQLSISDDGATVAFTRGATLNSAGWVADPTADPHGVERGIWAAKTSGTASWRLAEASNGALSPDGRYVAFAKDGEIYRVPTAHLAPTTDVDKGLKPFIRIWGVNNNVTWSPDGKKLAFVSSRTDHSFIAVYDTGTRKVTYMAPATDRDTSPVWSADSKRLAFIRRPGTPFGQQSQAGNGAIGNPSGPQFNAQGGGRGGRGGGGGGQGRGGRGGDGQPNPAEGATAADQRPGLMTATFAGGYNLSFWVADAATGEAHEFWHNAPQEKVFNGINSLEWEAGHVVFQLEPDQWTRFYSVPVPDSFTTPGVPVASAVYANPEAGISDLTGAPAEPISLTPQDGQIESSSFSEDGQYLYYGTNATDIERRHIWRVPIAGGAPEQITKGDGIEHDPVVLRSGKTIAVLSADYKRPQSVGIFSLAKTAPPCGEADQTVIFPTLPNDFPSDAHVMPQLIMTKAADGLDIHNQLFLPKDIRPGEKRPAIIFVHGGPVREMLLGYHYMEVYHLFYGVNQWLASQGYVVLSVNYRGGVGYGKSFRTAPNTNARGNAEYQDVLAGAKYLQSRPDVDPKRVGIWGLSYGGLLTSEALARNSDIFIAGVDLAGVHLYGNNLDPENLAYKSSAISEIDKWKSPVFLIQGDDDRNVNFAQTVGLVDLLRAHHVPYELMVMPDDTHETLLYRRWLPIFNHMEEFLKRNLAKDTAPIAHQK